MSDSYGVPDDENPEWTAGTAAHARRWQPGDPVGTRPSDRLRSVARDLRAQAEALEAEADALDAGTPPHAAE